MRRTFVIVGAWLLVTAVSILVAYAAVGQVRDRVVEQPRLVSSATSAGLASTTSTPPTASAPSTMADTTTSSSSLAPTTSSSATTTTVSSSTSSSQSGRIETYSTPGGSVSIEIFSDHLTLLGAVPAAGFSVAEQEISSTQMEIEFSGDGTEVKFKAKLEGGEVLVTVEIEGEGDD